MTARLSEKQTGFLLALYCLEAHGVREGPLDWPAATRAARDGRVDHGRVRTLRSLERRGLLSWSLLGGWVLTEAGTTRARALVDDPVCAHPVVIKVRGYRKLEEDKSDG